MAYIEELRFANYVTRLQQKISTTFEHHFKIFLKSAKIKIDHNLFKIKLPDPQNFKAYREAELNTSLINNFNSIKDTKFISPRFAMRKYLNMTEEEIKDYRLRLKLQRAKLDWNKKDKPAESSTAKSSTTSGGGH
jgi:hypothetical protein